MFSSMLQLILILAVAMFGAVGSAYAMGDAGKGPGNGGNSSGIHL